MPNLRLSLENRPENVLLVRRALGGVAETLGVDALTLNDISTAVSEACNNVVQHAYGGGPGPMDVEVYVQPDGLRVIVRDHGTGIQPRLDAGASEQAIGGIGLPLMLALARRVEFGDPEGGGTEVRLEFEAAHSQAAPMPEGGSWTRRVASGGEEIVIDIAPAALVRTVLPRVVCALAARARFSTDGIADAQVLADSLAVHTGSVISATHLSLAISLEQRALDLRISPILTGHALDGVGSVLDRVAERYTVTPDGTSEVLAVRLAESR